MFKIEELSGSLIRSGRFRDAIWPFSNELEAAMNHGVITVEELLSLTRLFNMILLNPCNLNEVASLANRMTSLVTRIPGYLDIVDPKEFNKNVNDSRETS